MSNTSALREILRNEADQRFGPRGWRSACATFLADDGESETVRVVNTRQNLRGEMGEPVTKASSEVS